jgi:hypothetical protein
MTEFSQNPLFITGYACALSLKYIKGLETTIYFRSPSRTEVQAKM